MYKFQKPQLNWKGMTIDYDWMLVIENMQDLISYHENTLRAQIMPAWNNLTDVQAGKAHINTNLGFLINLQAECDGRKGLIELTGIISSKIFEAKAKALSDTGKIYINKNGGFFSDNENITVLEEMFLDDENVIFPQYTEKDIDVKKWEGGKHWYAYIGNIQVEMHGDRKWSTPEKAKEMAKAFLQRMMYEKQFIIKES
jgi:hypothetical protein